MKLVIYRIKLVIYDQKNYHAIQLKAQCHNSRKKELWKSLNEKIDRTAILVVFLVIFPNKNNTKNQHQTKQITGSTAIKVPLAYRFAVSIITDYVVKTALRVGR